jgi:TusA-related sulfurtransferase
MNSFDLRKTLIPFSMLEVVNHFAKMAVGDEMEIIGDDAEVYRDLTNILPASYYEFVSEDYEIPRHDGEFRIKLRKTCGKESETDDRNNPETF